MRRRAASRRGGQGPAGAEIDSEEDAHILPGGTLAIETPGRYNDRQAGMGAQLVTRKSQARGGAVLCRAKLAVRGGLPRPSESLRRIASLVLAAFATSCATTNLPPISSADVAFEPARDEKRLWEDARAEEAKLRKNVKIYQDPLLVDYLEEVVQRLNPPAMAANPYLSYRVSVIEDPTLNAFAYPTGSLYVHTGLLARMENEDQLATVLGHEMTHVENRHMLRFQRSVRNKQIGFSIAAIAGAVIVASEEGHAVSEGKYGKAARIGVLSDVLLGLGLSLAIIAAVNGYGRRLEREADDGGFAKMSASGYDVGEAHLVYEALLDEHGESGKAEVFFFGSHPRLSARIEAAKQWTATHPGQVRAGRSRDQEAFRRRIRPVIREDARLNMEMGRLRLAEDELNRALSEMSEDPEAQFLLGRLKLKKAEAEKSPEVQERLKAEAMAAFRESIRLDPDRPGPHREAGLLAYRNGDFGTACSQFRLYLEIDPDAEDSQSIRDYELELKRDGHCP
ncbi:MAG: M48 family metalloprotease [Gemmatimonadota bacterium]